LLRACTVVDIVRQRRTALSAEVLDAAAAIVEAVRRDGEPALRRHAERFGELRPHDPLVIERPALENALRRLDAADRERLERVAGRIRAFAEAQRGAIRDVMVPVPGGFAGHRVKPVMRAGCYAPGGRYPLPSTVLMTAITARVAGVTDVIVASPKPPDIVLAAAAVAGADALVPVGGAQAIAALAYGAGPVPACDVVVGPGNRYVTAAKHLVSRTVGIDTLAGPSELVVFADASADPDLIAADLLAQAEHDSDAVPLLITTDSSLSLRVNEELRRQMADLPTSDVASVALANGGVICVDSLEQGIAACEAIAPEHLALHLADSATAVVTPGLRTYGTMFVGSKSGGVLGDYGAGPNHVLPTGGAARGTGGLSVLTFLRLRTWLRIDDAAAACELADDSAWFARAEGLEGHARSAEKRTSPRSAPAGRPARPEDAVVPRARRS
jgi:phosphoribosyl-ATP pyrophosphohydrolase/phosphoribosyl-AMP cyclohydrolase/histidinol dehydrogenase